MGRLDKREFIDATEFLDLFRWPMIVGLPYAGALMIQYASPNWFTIPTIGLMAVAWIIAALSFID